MQQFKRGDRVQLNVASALPWVNALHNVMADGDLFIVYAPSGAIHPYMVGDVVGRSNRDNEIGFYASLIPPNQSEGKFAVVSFGPALLCVRDNLLREFP